MRPWIAERLRYHTDSVFEEVTALARRHEAVNLGSGTPNTPVPDAIQAAAAEAIAAGHNQYAPGRGEAVLRAAVAAHAARFYGQEIDPATEITITSGVTEALHAALFSFVDPGDEVPALIDNFLVLVVAGVLELCSDVGLPGQHLAGQQHRRAGHVDDLAA